MEAILGGGLRLLWDLGASLYDAVASSVFPSRCEIISLVGITLAVSAFAFGFRARNGLLRTPSGMNEFSAEILMGSLALFFGKLAEAICKGTWLMPINNQSPAWLYVLLLLILVNLQLNLRLRRVALDSSPDDPALANYAMPAFAVTYSIFTLAYVAAFLALHPI